MAYLRMAAATSELPRCDVYVYDDVTHGLICANCALEHVAQTGKPHFIASSTQDMIDHLNQHRAAGDGVPWFEEVAAELRGDDASNFPRHPPRACTEL